MIGVKAMREAWRKCDCAAGIRRIAGSVVTIQPHSMDCPGLQAASKLGAKFCLECGRPLVIKRKYAGGLCREIKHCPKGHSHSYAVRETRKYART